MAIFETSDSKTSVKWYNMIKREHISFLILLQMVVGFGLTPIFFLKQSFGELAVVLYGIVAIVIFSAMGFWIWVKENSTRTTASEIEALGFGLVFGCIMAELVAAILMVHY